MSENRVMIALLVSLVLIASLSMIFLSSHIVIEKRAKSFSYICKTGDRSKRSIETINGTTHVFYYDYTDGVVIYKEWDHRHGSGIIVVTGFDQIKNKSNSHVVIYTKNSALYDKVKVGSVISLSYEGINWDVLIAKGRRICYLEVHHPIYVSVTGEISSDDPDFSEYLDYIIREEYHDYFWYWWFAWNAPLNPMSPMGGCKVWLLSTVHTVDRTMYMCSRAMSGSLKYTFTECTVDHVIDGLHW